MRSTSLLSPFVFFLLLIGFIAFFLDSSFLGFRNFFPIYEDDVNWFYFINAIACLVAVIGILYILIKTQGKETSSRSSSITKLAFLVSQFVIIAFAIITLLQLQRDGAYSLVNIIIMFSLSYGIAMYCMALLASKFLAWYRIGRGKMVLFYVLTMCIFIVFLITSILYSSYELSANIHPKVTSGSIGLRVNRYTAESNPLPSVYDTFFYYTYLLTFGSVYLITVLSLRTYLKNIRRVLFYLLFSVPLIYFMLNLLPFFTGYIASLVLYSPTFYGTLYTLLFSGTGPLGGILFSIVLLTLSSRMDNVLVRRYLSLGALGMLLFFIVNQNPPLQQSLLPPFGIISKSFIGLGCIMILVGIYSSVTLLSRRNTLTTVILKEMLRDPLFSSAVRSEHLMQIRGIINKNIDQIEVSPATAPKELSKDEVVELLNMVKKELSETKRPGKS